MRFAIAEEHADTPAPKPKAHLPAAELVSLITGVLDEGKAEDIVVIDLADRSSIADYFVIASGRSERQVVALGDQILRKLKESGQPTPGIEGKSRGDWLLLDAGDVIVHIFRPEVRTYYNLEKMWGALSPRTAEAR